MLNIALPILPNIKAYSNFDIYAEYFKQYKNISGEKLTVLQHIAKNLYKFDKHRVQRDFLENDEMMKNYKYDPKLPINK